MKVYGFQSWLCFISGISPMLDASSKQLLNFCISENGRLNIWSPIESLNILVLFQFLKSFN